MPQSPTRRPLTRICLPSLAGYLSRWRQLLLLLLASLLLSGCVDYDVAINFYSPNRGELIQSIHLDEKLASLGDASVQTWLQQVEGRARAGGGRIKRLSAQDLAVILPFNNGADLEEKFNQFFNPPPPQKTASNQTEFPPISAHLKLIQNNFLLVQRDRLIYDLDLTTLGGIAGGSGLLSPDSLLKVKFRLQTPWEVRDRTLANGTLQPAVSLQEGHQLVWTIQPGQKNHGEAVFWLPSPLGIGALAIGLLLAIGQTLKSFLTKPGEIEDTTS